MNITLQRVSMNLNDVYKRFITNKSHDILCDMAQFLSVHRLDLEKSVMLLMSFTVQYHVSERNCSTNRQHA